MTFPVRCHGNKRPILHDLQTSFSWLHTIVRGGLTVTGVEAPLSHGCSDPTATSRRSHLTRPGVWQSHSPGPSVPWEYLFHPGGACGTLSWVQHEHPSEWSHDIQTLNKHRTFMYRETLNRHKTFMYRETLACIIEGANGLTKHHFMFNTYFYRPCL